MFGNTLLNIVDDGKINNFKMNSNAANGNGAYANDNQNMQYVDVDGSEGEGSGTRNSSTADLLLPQGTNTIKLARLYWGGRINKPEFDLHADANKKIKIRKGTTGDYFDVTALNIDTVGLPGNSIQYQASADVTALIAAGGGGTYEVGNAPLSTGAVSAGGNSGGWGIVVVYENYSMGYRSIRLYDGFQQIFYEGYSQSAMVTLSGLNAPSGVISADDAKMGAIVWEGDANLAGDYLKINGHIFSNAVNQPDNPWNGTITDNGTYTSAKNPNFSNQMGIDIDEFDVGSGYGITSNASSIDLEFGTSGDKYFPGVFTFTISMKDPAITLSNTVADANNNSVAEKNEVLTYTINGKNSGMGNANSIEIIDTLPATVTYRPNSLQIISSPGVEAGIKTDLPGDDNAEYDVNGSVKTIKFKLGRGWDATAGGVLAPGETYEVRFQVTVNDPGEGRSVRPIMNVARIRAASDANVDFVDDGTAIINPDNGPLPVTLLSFNATLLPDNKVKIDWSTSMEVSCRDYTIEKSQDGKFFSELLTVPCSGTFRSVQSYVALDDVSFADGTVAYYRVRQSDIDQKKNYSKIIAVKLKTTAARITCAPNPFYSYLNINVEWHRSEVARVKILTLQGNQVISKNIEMIKGLNYISVGGLSNLPSGPYLIECISTGRKITGKIFKP